MKLDSLRRIYFVYVMGVTVDDSEYVAERNIKTSLRTALNRSGAGPFLQRFTDRGEARTQSYLAALY